MRSIGAMALALTAVLAAACEEEPRKVVCAQDEDCAQGLTCNLLTGRCQPATPQLTGPNQLRGVFRCPIVGIPGETCCVVPDAGVSDGGPRDGGPRDGGPRDGGPRDGGPRDASPDARRATDAGACPGPGVPRCDSFEDPTSLVVAVGALGPVLPAGGCATPGQGCVDLSGECTLVWSRPGFPFRNPTEYRTPEEPGPGILAPDGGTAEAPPGAVTLRFVQPGGLRTGADVLEVTVHRDALRKGELQVPAQATAYLFEPAIKSPRTPHEKLRRAVAKGGKLRIDELRLPTGPPTAGVIAGSIELALEPSPPEALDGKACQPLRQCKRTRTDDPGEYCYGADYESPECGGVTHCVGSALQSGGGTCRLICTESSSLCPAGSDCFAPWDWNGLPDGEVVMNTRALGYCERIRCQGDADCPAGRMCLRVAGAGLSLCSTPQEITGPYRRYLLAPGQLTCEPHTGTGCAPGESCIWLRDILQPRESLSGQTEYNVVTSFCADRETSSSGSCLDQWACDPGMQCPIECNSLAASNETCFLSQCAPLCRINLATGARAHEDCTRTDTRSRCEMPLIGGHLSDPAPNKQAFACTQPCNPIDSVQNATCQPSLGLGCYLGLADHFFTSCQQLGRKPEGEVCFHTAECALGLACLTTCEGCGFQKCTPLCNTAASRCPSGPCTPIPDFQRQVPGLGACIDRFFPQPAQPPYTPPP